MQTCKDLKVWQKSIKLVTSTYKLTESFPDIEKFGLISQMRRASVSIPSNIAEGFARKNKKENAHFVSIAYASGTELDTQIIISKELNFVSEEDSQQLEKQLEEILKMLYSYRNYLHK
ncbi:MAG: four helix bundle protein [Candidatus Magasanikbacteria bacterium CG_4_10_14_0_2_um_filter_33_14]|uniref:Four helix bundle protein n=1 Tax=Candidatus Magasanikbacteria bacterium CG_4_10_14_0_2_um_filter_33_14 TaxID=1974636 RepID=A0A2M7V8Z3_9BACT|nr:MAG: four helix bundle protein [Candidatus Magasanikbacteria bacterium CG_4_10_14_0_2_um_filter_33_14]